LQSCQIEVKGARGSRIIRMSGGQNITKASRKHYAAMPDTSTSHEPCLQCVALLKCERTQCTRKGKSAKENSISYSGPKARASHTASPSRQPFLPYFFLFKKKISIFACAFGKTDKTLMKDWPVNKACPKSVSRVSRRVCGHTWAWMPVRAASERPWARGEPPPHGSA
jgi:hypothetical protein